MKEYRRKFKTTVYVQPEYLEALDIISRVTRVPVAELIRQGIDGVLALYDEMPGGVRP